MYGASGKMGRGGAAGPAAPKRTIHAPPLHRRPTPTSAARLSMGGGGGGARLPGAAATTSSSSPSTSSLQVVEESFSLVRENPLNFGMAIKLAPDLVEEIKRVEAQGGTARIKFDANSNNPNGNVIHVGEKTFKFTWSREPGDYCDIYEECRSGEDGNGLLIESGATWRKLNVERELDESTKNHVKMRSAEAERKLKSRKVQVLDPNNPSMKKNMRELASAESNSTWRNFKHRKEPPFKKPKSEPSSGGPPKSVFRSGLSSTLPKGKLSSGSPLPSQMEQFGGSSSPLGSSNFGKGHASVADAIPQNINRTPSSDKEKQIRPSNNINRDKFKHSQNMAANHTELRSLIISLLLENQQKGMNLKALEKAVGDAMPNSVRQIDPILRQIATIQAPGKYFLKQGVETESFKKPPPQSASSPENNCGQSLAPQKSNQTPTLDPFSMGNTANDEEHGELNSSPVHMMENIEKIDIMQDSPEQFSNKKASDDSERAGGSSDSDSDSDSSKSGSDNRSRSKSKSPVESTSDSDSDASSSSQQTSDEDVNIMTSDDEKEQGRDLQESGLPQLNSSAPSSFPDDEYVDIENHEKQDDHDSDVDVVDSPRNSPEDGDHHDGPAAVYSFPNEEGEVPIEQMRPPSADDDERQADESESPVNDGFKQGPHGTHEGFPKHKYKRPIDDKRSDDRGHNRKKSKSNSSSLPVSGTISSIFGPSPFSSPDQPPEGAEEGLIDQMGTGTMRDGLDDPFWRTEVKEVVPDRRVSDSQQPGQKSSEFPGRSEPTPGEKRPSSRRDSLDHVKYSDRNLQTSEGSRTQKGFSGESIGEDSLGKERKPMKVDSEGVGDKLARTSKSHHPKSENLWKVKDGLSHSSSHMGYSHKDNSTGTAHRSPAINGRGPMLRREYSDLELGEFREPQHDETGLRKQFETKSSDKPLKSKQVDSEYRDSDSVKGKPSNMITADSGKNSTPDLEARVAGIPDGTSKIKGLENHTNDLMKPHQKGSRHMQFYQSQGDHVEVGSQNNKASEINGKSRSCEPGTGQVGGLDLGHGVAFGKISGKPAEQKHDPVHIAPNTTKEIKKQKRNVVNGSNDRRKEISLSKSFDSSQKKKEPSVEEGCSPYSKYEKEEPELKGPVKDMAQYKEYVSEYQEKYGIYCSLNKLLESNREEFIKYGKDLDTCKGRDMKKYNDIVEQMTSSFRQCGEKHKRLKKLFNVLHEELKHLKEMITEFASLHCKD